MGAVGIIGAMEEEIALLKDSAEILTAKNVLGLDFYIANLCGKNAVLVRSGIGKVNAAVCTQVLIDHFAVDCVINVGVAGGLYKDLRIGDIVISSDAVQHDMEGIDGANIYVGRIASGDQFIADRDRKNRIIKLFNAYCAEMEGAAVAHTCYLNRIPFVVIRSISDNANGEAGMDFAEFSKHAALNSARIVEAMVKELQI